VIVVVVVILIIWAIASALSGKKDVDIRPEAAAPPPVLEPPERELRRAQSWEDGATATVGKSFGKGGVPTGISKDGGGIATAEMDEDFERLKRARAFEPRATKLDLDETAETESGEENA